MTFPFLDNFSGPGEKAASLIHWLSIWDILGLVLPKLFLILFSIESKVTGNLSGPALCHCHQGPDLGQLLFRPDILAYPEVPVLLAMWFCFLHSVYIGVLCSRFLFCLHFQHLVTLFNLQSLVLHFWEFFKVFLQLSSLFFPFSFFFCQVIYCCCSVTKSCPTLCHPLTAACQASLSFTISQSLLKFMSIKSVMPSNHLILCCLLLPSRFPSIRVFSNESVLRMR